MSDRTPQDYTHLAMALTLIGGLAVLIAVLILIKGVTS